MDEMMMQREEEGVIEEEIGLLCRGKEI